MFAGQASDRIDQIDAMRMGAQYSFSISCRNFQLNVRPLALAEHVEITGKVSQKLAEMPEHQRNRLAGDTILAMETLVRASTSDYGKDDPKISEYILSRMTPGELHFLFKQYTAECDKVDPSIEAMPPEKLRELVAELKKKQDDLGSALTELSFWEMANVCQYLLTA